MGRVPIKKLTHHDPNILPLSNAGEARSMTGISNCFIVLSRQELVADPTFASALNNEVHAK